MTTSRDSLQRIVVLVRYLIVAVVLVACDAGQRPIEPDAVTGVQVTGCDDPMLWSSPSVYDGRVYPSIGGGACSPAQYPLHRAWIGWVPDLLPETERLRIDRTCWRVTAATPGSGWTAGDTFVGGRDGAEIGIAGFESTLVIEGRALRDDGTILVALEPDEAALDRASVLDEDAAETIVVASRDAWVTRDSVHFQNLDVTTDEIVDASASLYGISLPVTVHRTTSGFVQRWWRKMNDTLVSEEVTLGTGTRARSTDFGNPVVVDSELLLAGRPTPQAPIEVLRRTTLAAEPIDVVGGWYRVALHLPGSIELHTYPSSDVASIPVGDGALLPVHYSDAETFFDGAGFRRLEATQNVVSLGAPITPRAEDLAAIGTPRGVYHGVVFGDRGLLLAVDASSDLRGPRVATFAELFGDPDARLGAIAADSSAYVIRFGDGSAKLYDAPFVDYCE